MSFLRHGGCMRIKITLFLVLFLALGCVPLSASVFQTGDSNILSRRDSLDDDLYVFGNFGEVYGVVEGDLTAFCYEHDADGIILGSANIFGYGVRLGGEVRQSARLIGYNIYTGATIGRNLVILGKTIDIKRDAVIQKDLDCGGDIIHMDGTVHGDADIGGRIVYISGNIDGDVKIKADEIYIDSPAQIGGELTYTSGQKAEIADDVIIDGGIYWEEPEEDIDTRDILPSVRFFFHIIFFLMTLLTGLFLILIFNRHTHEAVAQIGDRFWRTLAIGLLSIIIFIGGSVVLTLLIIGIPLAVILIFLGLVLFYIGKIYASIALGRLVFKLIGSGNKIALGWEFIVGLIIMVFIFRIPGLGWVIYFLVTILGTGAAITGYLSLCNKFSNGKGNSVDVNNGSTQ